MASKKTKKQPKLDKKSDNSEYSAKQITVLEGLEPVRKRPGMYIGTTGPAGLHHLVWEVVDNSIDEAMGGFCDEITLILHRNNSISVEDNGRGIPVDIHKQYKISALELVLTKLHAGGKFGEGGYKVSGGLHGVGVSVVNALSTYLRAEVYRDGKIWMQEYSCGKPKGRVKPIGKTSKRGTKITFEADASIFEKVEYTLKTIYDHLRQQAFLTKGVTINVVDERIPRPPSAAGTPAEGLGADEKNIYSFYFEGGIASFVKSINRNCARRGENVFYIQKAMSGVDVEIALQYTDDFKETLLAFANNIYNLDGGTHVLGFRSALTRVLNNYARKGGYLKEKDDNLTGDDVREGLNTVISVKLKDPQFEGQTKSKLGNPEARTAVESVMNEAFTSFCEEHPKDAEAIITKCIISAKARLAAKAARDTVIRKGLLEGLTLPGKLADCSTRNSDKSELYIVEGDSAGGCFSGETKIALVDGRNINFEQLVKEYQQGKNNYCYTIKNDGAVGVAPIRNPRKTKINAGVVKIILDNGEEIICTPDHKFMLRDGSYKEAKNLTPQDSLLPLYRQYSKIGKRITIKGYELVFSTKENRWIFTHLLSNEYNRGQEIYRKNGKDHIHHLDFNKLNNNPDNLLGLSKRKHLKLHTENLEKTIHREDVKQKCRQIRQSQVFKEKMSEIMSAPKMKVMLSKRAKKQWQNEAYKNYMVEKFLKFYNNNQGYREKISKILNEAQENYWSKKNNRKLQSEKTKNFFGQHPEQKEMLSQISKKQWCDPRLKAWRSDKTKEQWTDKFRTNRKEAYNQTYLRKALSALHSLYKKHRVAGQKLQEFYSEVRKSTNDKSLIKYETVNQRFFGGDGEKFEEAVFNYNHKIKAIIPLKNKMDVYDLEVPGTHNFALASGVFVHNSAKQGRDRDFQAILPLRGKILNIEKSRLDKMLANNEIKSLIVAMGTNIGEQFDVTNLRYNKIILMTDADVDGAHIRTLLLTLFFRHFPEIIKQKHLFIAQPPLFRLQRGKEILYAFSDDERDKFVKQMLNKKEEAKTKGKKRSEAESSDLSAKALASAEALAKEEGVSSETDAGTEPGEGEKVKGVLIQRYKGLGEMNPDQLWETTMSPASRLLKIVTIEDAQKADEIFDILMGAEVGPRKHFIQTNAKAVKNLDI